MNFDWLNLIDTDHWDLASDGCTRRFIFSVTKFLATSRVGAGVEWQTAFWEWAEDQPRRYTLVVFDGHSPDSAFAMISWLGGRYAPLPEPPGRDERQFGDRVRLD